jgi:uncharacterized membrane protein
MKLLAAALALLFPFLVYAGLQRFSARAIALAAGGALLARAVARARGEVGPVLRGLLLPALLVGGLLGLAAILDEARFLLALPVLVNASLLLAFARSLRSGPPLVERFARMESGDLKPEEVRYCRRLTWIWCGFFASNGAVAGALAAAGSLEAWTLYNGLIAYLAIGLLFAGERAVRAWRFRRYGGGLGDPLLRRLFPPKTRA